MLLDSGAQYNRATNKGNTPLHTACLKGHRKVARLLLHRGADREKEMENGATPLHLASGNGHVDVVELLLRKGAEKEKVMANGATPLYIAKTNGHAEVVRSILSSFADEYKTKDLDVIQGMLREQLFICLKKGGGDIKSNPVHITVQRDQLLEGVCSLAGQEWSGHDGIQVVFEGENSRGDGLRREYLRLVTKEIIDPDRALFCEKGQGDQACRLQPLPDSDINPDHLSYLEMMGKLIGMVLLHGECMHDQVRFTRPFLKQLLRQPLDVEDLRSVDPELYKNKVEFIMKCSEEDLASLELNFMVEKRMFDETGDLKEVSLLEGTDGSQTVVTTENRSEYLQLLCHYLLTSQIERQIEAVMNGLLDVIPEDFLMVLNRCLTPEDLDILIAGQPTLDVDEWRLHTLYESGYDADSPQILWFWELLSEWSHAELSKLLIFVTGSGSVGPRGFKHLQGYNQREHKFTIRQGSQQGENEAWNLPRVQTCFNVLMLPPYLSKEHLREKLVQGIMEGSVFDEGAVAEFPVNNALLNPRRRYAEGSV